MYWWLVLHPLYPEHQKMKSCNRSPCSFPACAVVSCAWTLSDVKHHPVTGITPRQGRDHMWNEQSSTLAMLGMPSCRCPLQPAGNLIQHKVDFWKTKTKAALSDAIWWAQEGLFESTRLKLIICSVFREKKFFFIHPSCMKAKGRRTDSSHIQNIPHGRCVLAWAFLWVAVHFKTIYFIVKSVQDEGENSSHPAFHLLWTISHLYFFSLNIKKCA